MNKPEPQVLLQFIKYGFVGGINFITGVALFYVLLKIVEVNYFATFTITWLFGIFLTYTINFLWVFKPEDRIEFKKRFPKYFSVYLISYLVNIFILSYIVKRYQWDPFYTQLGILPLVIPINFLGFKYWGLK